MKKIRKHMSKLFLLIFIMNLFNGSVRASNTTQQTADFSIQDVGFGKIVPSESVNDVFSDSIDVNNLASFQFERSISLTGDSVVIDIKMISDSSSYTLKHTGKMYQSFRHTSDLPVYVGVFENPDNVTNDFDVVYFELSNADSPNNLKHDLRDSPSISMYLRDQGGNLFDFGTALSYRVELDSVIEKASAKNDINWFIDVVEGTHKEEVIFSPKSTYSNLWAGDLHSLTFRIADYEHLFMATPYIDFSYGDVPTAGVTPFIMSLKISESHRYRKVGTTKWTINTADYTRSFIIDNVQLAWTAGGNTGIQYVAPHLNVNSNGGGLFNFVGLAAAVAGISPQTATLATILTVADGILGLGTGSNTTFTNTDRGGALINTRAYKIKFPVKYNISDSGYGMPNPEAQRFEYMAFMSTSNSTLARKHWTNAVADFTFKLSWASITGQSGSKTYTSSKALGYYNNY